MKQIISLEDHELFSQLCAVVNLVRSGPRMGLFRSFVSMDESVVRVWKNWLGRRNIVDAASSCPSAESLDHEVAHGNVKTPLSSQAKGKGVFEAITIDVAEDEDIIWFDLYKHIGLRVKVRETKWSGETSMLLSNEDEVVSYEVEYKGLSSINLTFFDYLTALVRLC